MNFDSFLSNRANEIKECKDYIKKFEEVYGIENYLKEKKSLIKSFNKKIKLIKNVDENNFETLLDEIDSLDEIIYRQYKIFEQKIIDRKKQEQCSDDDKKISIKELKNIFMDFNHSKQDKNIKNGLLKIFPYFLKNPFIVTTIFFALGALFFCIYFQWLGYTPKFNKESFLYYLIILMTNTLIFLCIGILLVACILYLMNQAFEKYSKKMFSSLNISQTGILLMPILIGVIYLSILNFTNDKYKVVAVSCIIIYLVFLYIYYIKYKSTIFNIFLQLLIFVLFILIIFFHRNSTKSMLEILMEIGLVVFLFSILIASLLSVRKFTLLIGIPILLILFFTLVIRADFIYKIIKISHFGNYTLKALILDPKTQYIIPKELLQSDDENNECKTDIKNTENKKCKSLVEVNNKVIKLIEPKILSSIGDEYYIEIQKDSLSYRFTIPKNLILSEHQTIEKKDNQPAPTTQSNP